MHGQHCGRHRLGATVAMQCSLGKGCTADSSKENGDSQILKKKKHKI